MNSGFEQRSTKSEWMDDFTTGGAELREALAHLRRLNWIFGASSPAIYGVKRLWKDFGRPGRLTVLDIGSGCGDINRRILRWADKQGVEMRVILTDVTEEAREEAEQLFRDDLRVTFVKQDLFHLPARLADIVTASQFAHHFHPERLPSMLERMMDVSKAGVVINDIHRH
jgi:ubiquinone/menaquinone biosynthesis C-methylase UbiE